MHGARRGGREGGGLETSDQAYGLCDGAPALAQQSVFNAQVEQSLCFRAPSKFFLFEFIIILEHNQLELSPFFFLVYLPTRCALLSICFGNYCVDDCFCLCREEDKQEEKEKRSDKELGRDSKQTARISRECPSPRWPPTDYPLSPT